MKKVNEQQKTKILSELKAKNGNFELIKADKVGATIGKELTKNAGIALLFGSILIVLYITMRFELIYAISAIIALLHDLCKANFYKVDYRNAKNALGVWEKVPYYTIEDTIPYGHGEKSVMMITEYMKLTPEEKYSIRWHMGYTEPKENYNAIGASYTKYPIALLTHEADLEATYFYDT